MNEFQFLMYAKDLNIELLYFMSGISLTSLDKSQLLVATSASTVLNSRMQYNQVASHKTRQDH